MVMTVECLFISRNEFSYGFHLDAEPAEADSNRRADNKLHCIGNLVLILLFLLSNHASPLNYSFMDMLQFCDKMPNQLGHAYVDCDKHSSMPTVSYTIGGKQFNHTPEEV
jgi:hypothetical protein